MNGELNIANESVPRDVIQDLLTKYLPDLDATTRLRVATELVQLHAAREGRSGMERKLSEVKVEFGEISIVNVGELTKQCAEELFAKVPDSFSVGDIGFNIDLDPFVAPFYSSSDKPVEKKVPGKVLFQSKKLGLKGEILLGWKGSNLTVLSAELTQNSNLTNFLYDDPDGTTQLIQQAVEGLGVELKKYSVAEEDEQKEVLTEHAWQYALSEIRAPIHASNERNAAEKKRQEAIFAEYLAKAEEYYAFFLECLQEERPTLLTDSEQSGESESEFWDTEKWKQLHPQMRQNCLNLVATVIKLHPSLDIHDQELRSFVKQFIARVQIGHNRTEKFGNQVGKPRLISGGKSRELISLLGLQEDVVYLPCAVLDPESESGKQVGTGWSGDTCYVFDLEKLAARTLVMVGDIDQPSHNAAVSERIMTLADSLLPSAIFSYLHEIKRGSKGEKEYNEVVVLGEVDIANLSIKKLELPN